MMVDEVDRDDPAYKKRASINLMKSFLRKESQDSQSWNQVWKTDGSAHSHHSYQGQQ
jgi:hypothetical protein